MALNIIILAGGKGTRIKSVLKDTPKVMANIAGKPFLDWLLIWIDSWELDIPINILISTCKGHNTIKNYCIRRNLNVLCIPEEKPLGTFGAIANVASTNISNDYLVLNGDTIFKADLKKIYEIFKNNIEKKPLLILKESLKNQRFGGYEHFESGWKFSHKNTKFISMGSFFINYEDLKERWINTTNVPFRKEQINNIEKQYMIDNHLFNNVPISAEVLESNTPFIDIGIPISLKEAQTFIPKILKN